MVYMTPDELGWRPYVQTWLQRKFQDESVLDMELKELLWSYFNDTVDTGLDMIRNGLVEYIATVNIQLVVNVCNFLEIFFSE